MLKGRTYIKDLGDFINKVKQIQKTPAVRLVTAAVVGSYLSFPHEMN